MTLDEIVSDYIRTYRRAASAEMRDYQSEPIATAAIRRAALCEFPDGKRHPHQCLIPRRLLELSEERLQAARKRLSPSADFAALHAVVEQEIGGIHGIGKLTVYDIAHRIGAYFGKAPKLVYLHRGTRVGARVFNITGDSFDPRYCLTPSRVSSPRKKN